jgi:hypothetical protein
MSIFCFQNDREQTLATSEQVNRATLPVSDIWHIFHGWKKSCSTETEMQIFGCPKTATEFFASEWIRLRLCASALKMSDVDGALQYRNVNFDITDELYAEVRVTLCVTKISV